MSLSRLPLQRPLAVRQSAAQIIWVTSATKKILEDALALPEERRATLVAALHPVSSQAMKSRHGFERRSERADVPLRSLFSALHGREQGVQRRHLRKLARHIRDL